MQSSHQLYARARKVLPGGVNSPVRAFAAVGGEPPFIRSAKGATLETEDGRRLVDLYNSWGPAILGHAHPDVVAAVQRQAAEGLSYGAPCAPEVEMAELVTGVVPGLETVRFVNSGTEACMSAVRLARAATGRDAIVKFAGCYHGHADSFLVEAGSGAATLGEPNSPGVPRDLARLTMNARFNDAESVRRAFESAPGGAAAVIVEPVAGNMGCVPPEPGFLEELRTLCGEFGALLIFDEVMTGFRIATAGAVERYGVRPDLVCLGKVVGGGLPVAAYGGTDDIMRRVAPDGPVYQAGTLSGNPLGMAAGLATLKHLQQHPDVYTRLERIGARIEEGLAAAIARLGAAACVQRVGSMLTLFFHPGPVRSWDDASQCDTDAFARFFQAMLDRGWALPPSQYECWFLSTALEDETVTRLVGDSAECLKLTFRESAGSEP